jgi:hypothetical protein
VSCGKKPYTTKKQARWQSRNMHETIRVYWCNECKAFHTTQQRYDKILGGSPERKTKADRQRRNNRRKNLG